MLRPKSLSPPLSSQAAVTAFKIAVDLAVLSLAYWLAILLRFDGVPVGLLSELVRGWPVVVGVQFAALLTVHGYATSWRYTDLSEVIGILRALCYSALILLGVRLATGRVPGGTGALIPIGVVLIGFAFAFAGVAALRVARRITSVRVAAAPGASAAVRTLLIGAGWDGTRVAREIAAHPHLNIRPVGFVDDDPAKRGRLVAGLRVLGTTTDLARIAAEREARLALVTIASGSAGQVRRIVSLCEAAGLETRTLPGLLDLLERRVNVSRVRDVVVGDLLRRPPVELDLGAISDDLSAQVVAITGAGGSIGSELSRQVLAFNPQALVLIERAEPALFAVHTELGGLGGATRLVPCVGDVCDPTRMRAILAEHRPTVVLHAAAHKHVPLMEANPGEALKNNVGGTRVVADLAAELGVAKFVLISTDKAVNPSSVMGATKRLAELYVQSLDAPRTRFLAVRFGNVLGSAGSVVPTFARQIARGGPVTVTHPDMRRYFMTIPEACQLVLQAAAMGRGGEVFLLDMGEPVRVVDLARDMIRLSGLRPDDDIAITYTGIRPGEKLFEELTLAEEQADRTRHPKIWTGRCQRLPHHELLDRLTRLSSLADADALPLRRELRRAVPGYRPSGAAEAPQHIVLSDLSAVADP